MEKNSEVRPELGAAATAPEVPPHLGLLTPPSAPPTTGQAALKEAKRLAKLSGSFGALSGLLLGVLTNLAAFWVTGQMSGIVVVYVVFYAAVLGLIGAAFGGLVGAASGAVKAWWAARS